MPYPKQVERAEVFLRDETREGSGYLAGLFDEYEVKGMETERKATQKAIRQLIDAYPAARQALAMLSLDVEHGRHLRLLTEDE